MSMSLLKSLVDQNGVLIAHYQIGVPLKRALRRSAQRFTPAFDSVDELEEFCRTNFRRILDFADGLASPANECWTTTEATRAYL